MAATKVLIVLSIASLLLVNEQEIISLQTSPDSWAGQAGLKPGEVFRDQLKTGSEGPEMVVIPAGKFRMGDIQGKYGKGELPVHQVNFQEAFAASKYEITFAEYDDFAKATKLTMSNARHRSKDASAYGRFCASPNSMVTRGSAI